MVNYPQMSLKKKSCFTFYKENEKYLYFFLVKKATYLVTHHGQIRCSFFTKIVNFFLNFSTKTCVVSAP